MENGNCKIYFYHVLLFLFVERWEKQALSMIVHMIPLDESTKHIPQNITEIIKIFTNLVWIV